MRDISTEKKALVSLDDTISRLQCEGRSVETLVAARAERKTTIERLQLGHCDVFDGYLSSHLSMEFERSDSRGKRAAPLKGGSARRTGGSVAEEDDAGPCPDAEAGTGTAGMWKEVFMSSHTSNTITTNGPD